MPENKAHTTGQKAVKTQPMVPLVKSGYRFDRRTAAQRIIGFLRKCLQIKRHLAQQLLAIMTQAQVSLLIIYSEYCTYLFQQAYIISSIFD